MTSPDASPASSFLALIERGNTHDVEAWAEAVLARFSENVSTVGQKTVHSSCTIGLTAVPTSGSSLDAVVADVLEAVRRGRSQGGNQIYHLDKADTDTRVQAYDMIWVKHIKSALMENRFRLVQQPVASLQGEDPEHVRRAGAHARSPGQGSPARGLHGGGRAQ